MLTTQARPVSTSFGCPESVPCGRHQVGCAFQGLAQCPRHLQLTHILALRVGCEQLDASELYSANDVFQLPPGPTYWAEGRATAGGCAGVAYGSRPRLQ